ncbi:glutathione S-transferase N-terminal domain-containing protein [Leptolyngbya sp. 15MV]|nr:glutathione S-transferase N-terminal domain-containing protein [Leptolyngbya sp. 15MV]
MAGPVTIWTLDWVPDGPRGFVRDLRLRWACEEAGIPYAIRTVAFDDRHTNHLDAQPFGQVPMLEDGDVRLFESGAGVLHLARLSEALMPRDAAGEAEVAQWVIAALNSIEMVTMPWIVLQWSSQEFAAITEWMDTRLNQLEAVLATREWLVGNRFTAADLMMADVLRLGELRGRGERPASEAYVERVTARPAFVKAHADQLALYAAADKCRGEN